MYRVRQSIHFQLQVLYARKFLLKICLKCILEYIFQFCKSPVLQLAPGFIDVFYSYFIVQNVAFEKHMNAAIFKYIPAINSFAFRHKGA